MSRVPLLLSSALVCLLIAAAPALATGEPYLVRDLEDEIASGGSFPDDGVLLETPGGERLTFSASDEQHGRELWSSDGTSEGTHLVLDIARPGDNLFVGDASQRHRLLSALAGEPGRQDVWITDGTTAGTELLFDSVETGANLLGVVPRPAGEPELMILIQGDTVWSTRGTRSSLRRLGPFDQEQSGGSNGARFVFLRGGGSSERRLWSSDGTPEGTGWIGVGPEGEMTPDNASTARLADGRLLFYAMNEAAGREMWVSDGTAAGTRMLADLHPGPAGTYSTTPLVTADGSRAFFAASTEEGGGSRLIGTDGTPAGTLVLKSSNDQIFLGTAVGQRVVFLTSQFWPQGELWTSDGTVEGTERLIENCPECSDPPMVLPPRVGSDLGRFYFTVSTFEGYELWVSDGTPAGTRFLLERPTFDGIELVADLPEHAVFEFFSDPEDLLYGLVGSRLVPLGRRGFELLGRVNDVLLYEANDPQGHPQPWATDGTRAGTRLLVDIARGGDSAPEGLTTLGGEIVFFWGEPGTRNQNLWASDGTAAGTRQLSQIPPPPPWPDNGEPLEPGSTLHQPVEVDGLLVYLEDDPRGDAVGIWVSDGTAAGTRRIARLSPRFPVESSRLVAGERFAYLDTLGGGSRGLVLIDPQAETVFNRGGEGTVTGAVELAGIEYFLAREGEVRASSLFTTDGAIVPVAEGWRDPTAPVVLGERLYFAARALDSNVLSLWESDGTRQGTGPVVELGATDAGASILASRTKLFVVGLAGSGRDSVLWVSNGTASGTEEVFRGRQIESPEVWGDRLAFAAAEIDSDEGQELWISDGTVFGTRLLADLFQGPADGRPSELTAVGDRLFFTATDGPHGVELWQTDGTLGGTRRVTDLASGTSSSTPDELTVVGDLLYFTASDNRRGRELWALPLEDDGGGGGGGSEPPAPPAGAWITTDEIPGYRFKARITDQQGGRATAALEPGCIDETLCVSGRVPGRSEAFVRIVGPKPNGFFWPTLAKFTTSQVEVWVERLEDGADQYYLLPGATAGGPDTLPALFDRQGFPGPGVPASRDSKVIRWADATAPASGTKATGPPIPPGSSGVVSPEQPGFRFHVRLTSQTGAELPHREEIDCIDETVCVSGSVPGRSELFLRVIGPRPNGFLWPTLVRFTTSRAEVWIEQLSTGAVQYYDLPAASPGDDRLDGLFDRQGFVP